MFSIKKAIKKERARLNRNYFISFFILILVAYLTFAAISLSVVKGWQSYFTIAYALIIELLILINIFKLYFESKFSVDISFEKIKIHQPLKGNLPLQPSKVVYVDVISNKDAFDIVIFIKGKRVKRLLKLNENGDFKRVYRILNEKYNEDEFYYYIIKKGGAKKYFYLYKLYKNCFEAEFSRKAMEYIKLFMEEYNLS